MRVLPSKHYSLCKLTCAQRTHVDFFPQHWLLCHFHNFHLGLYKFESEFNSATRIGTDGTDISER